MESPLVSIIIPIYNAQTFLKQAIDSVLKQTYPHFELLLIDDGSTDNSPKICLDYQKRDNRVKVFLKANEGILKTRLYALSHCVGEYICFIDADDWVIPDYLKVLVGKVLEYKVDLVCINAYRILDKWGLIKQPVTCYKDTCLTEEKLKKYNNFYLRKIFSNACWGKLYKKELFEQAVINSISIHYGEDAYINLMLSPLIHSIYLTDTFGYYYRFGGSTTGFVDRVWKDCCTLYREQKKFVLQYNPPYIKNIAWYLQDQFCTHIKLMIYLSSLSKKEIVEFIETVFDAPIYHELTTYPHNDVQINEIFASKDALRLYSYLKKQFPKRIVIRHKLSGLLFSMLNSKWFG